MRRTRVAEHAKPMRKWRISLTATFYDSDVVEVEAEDEDAARDLADDAADFSDPQYDRSEVDEVEDLGPVNKNERILEAQAKS